MALQRISYPDRASWLTGRFGGIGASECAALVGMSPWMTQTELWEIKTGIRQSKDLSGNDAVERGNRMEDAIRYFFACAHPEYTVEYHPFDILFQEDRPHFFATLDGELTDKDGRRGILEIKTGTPVGKDAWSQWDNQVPDHYYIQLLSQLLATGYDFAILQAALWNRNGDITLKDPYIFERSEYEADLAWLKEKQDAFWHSVKTKQMPSLSIQF